MPEPITSISIPATVQSPSTPPYTLYEIHLRGPVRSWRVSHRYSDFTTLHATLLALGPPPNPLPPKTFFSLSDASKIESRRIGLESYLKGILYAEDPKWRQADAWKAFLSVPTARTEPDAESWMEEYRFVKEELQSLRMEVRDKAPGHALNAKRSMTNLGGRIKGLEQVRGVTGGERVRREDMVDGLKREREALERMFSGQQRSDDRVLERATLLPAPAKPSSSTRKFGNTNASPPSLLENQRVIMQQQDETLGSLSDIIKRQQQIGLTIGQELDLQNGLLEEVDESVNRVQGRLKGVSKKLDRVLKG
ncbi:hypothetical protein SpCBS45565_g06813 [Spizellomyces sp. 'palustris']|nr:hypothetical protein SpCBS45565_g06813 [Spizellomyces sp. 'palustris']